MMEPLKILWITSLVIGFSVVAGAGIGLLIRKIPHRYNDAVLGFASGIMLAAAVLGLILPAAEGEGPWAIYLTIIGVFAGAFLVSLLDRIVPHLHFLAGLDRGQEKPDPGKSKILLFTAAIAIHKLPEGLAAGVSFGTGALEDVLTVAGSIALQNIPEAMVIVAPLLAVGVTMRRTLFISLLIGLISMVGTILGYFIVSIMISVLPLVLAFAGGTMLYVISDEMIPETHSHGFEKQATFALLSGFMLIVVMQQCFG